MVALNSNYMSNIAQHTIKNLDQAITDITNSISTGSRINSAKDNPSGFIFCRKINFLNKANQQAVQNAGDGISLAQTAEGNLNEISDFLLKVQELTMRSLNGVYDEEQLQAIQDDVTKCIKGMEEIAERSSFNGVKLLSNTVTDPNTGEVTEKDLEIKIHTGPEDTHSTTLKIKNMGLKSLGLDNFSVLKPSPKAIEKAQTDYDNALKASSAAPEDIALKKAAAEAKEKLEQQKNLDPSKNLEKIQSALNKINTTNAELGSSQNKLSSDINNLNTTIINQEAARSRFQDTEYDSAISTQIRFNIRRQAAQASLAQANSSPQSVLSLMR